MSFRIKKGDLVKVIAGKEKGKTGKVIKLLVDRHRALVEKLNRVKKHSRPSKQNPQGGLVEKEASIHLSNLMYYDPKKTQTLRIGAYFSKEGKKQRIFRKQGIAV